MLIALAITDIISQLSTCGLFTNCISRVSRVSALALGVLSTRLVGGALSSRFADFRCGRRPFHSHDVGWSHGVLKRSQPLSLAASRRSGGAAHKLDKLRKRGFSITPLPIHTHELAPPALPA